MIGSAPMPTTLSLTESAIFTALTTVLNGMLPGVQTIRGQDNRVPEPAAANFIEMWPLLRTRLETNIDTLADCAFIGSISGTIMAVSSVSLGTIIPNAPVFGPTVRPGTAVTGSLGGCGGPGAYVIAPPQNVPSGALAAGTNQVLTPTRLTVQLNVHGPASGDNVQVIQTLFRDQYAVDAFAAANPAVAPLYTSEPRQIAFENAEAQYEERWSIDLELQINPVVQVGQQFADQLIATAEAAESLS